MRVALLALFVVLVLLAGCGGQAGCDRAVTYCGAQPGEAPTAAPDLRQQALDALAPRCAETRDALLQDAVRASQEQATKGHTLTPTDALGAALYVLDHAPHLLKAPDGLTNCAVVLTFVGAVGTPQGATDLAAIVNAR